MALNITTPDSGVLLGDLQFAGGATVPKGRFIQARVEAEIAFLMRADLAGAIVTRDDVIAATGHAAPSLEILDTRILPPEPRAASSTPSPTTPGSCWQCSAIPSQHKTCAGPRQS